MHSRHKGHAIQLILILLLIAIPANAGQIVIGYGSSTTWIPKNDANCVGAWYMDGASGATETDRSTNGNDLTNNGTVGSGNASLPAGYSGYYRIFSSPNYLSHADSGALDINGGTATVSLSAWIYVTTAPASTAFEGIISKYDPSSNQRQYALSIVGTGSSQFKIEFDVSHDSTSGGTADYVLSTTTTYAQNTWYHIVGVANNTDLRIYVNGSLDCTPAAHTGGIFNGSREFWVGRYVNTYLVGRIDEAIVFNRALTSTEVTSIYNNGISGNKGGSD